MKFELWEGKCTHCGLCCHEKVVIGDELLFDLESRCEHYDAETHQCRIYNERLSLNGRCRRVTPFRAMFARYLPDECAYVQWARTHRLRFALKRRIRFLGGQKGSSDQDPAALTAVTLD